MRKLSLLILMMILPLLANADAVEINGIYYNLDSSAKQAEVSRNPNKYSGTINIPKVVEYNGNSYYVKIIGDGAFYGCSNLKSITFKSSYPQYGHFIISAPCRKVQSSC